jgi:hypothetical protein
MVAASFPVVTIGLFIAKRDRWLEVRCAACGKAAREACVQSARMLDLIGAYEFMSTGNRLWPMEMFNGVGGGLPGLAK